MTGEPNDKVAVPGSRNGKNDEKVDTSMDTDGDTVMPASQRQPGSSSSGRRLAYFFTSDRLFEELVQLGQAELDQICAAPEAYDVLVDEQRHRIWVRGEWVPLFRLRSTATVLLWLLMQSYGKAVYHEKYLRLVGSSQSQLESVHTLRHRAMRQLGEWVKKVMVPVVGERHWGVATNWRFGWITESHDPEESVLLRKHPGELRDKTA